MPLRTLKGAVFALFLLVLVAWWGQASGQNAERLRQVCGRSCVDGRPVVVHIDSQGIIRSVERPEKPCAGPDVYLAPGLIDNQINGYAGVAFKEDTLTVERVRMVVHELWKAGVTTLVPTVTTASKDVLLRSFRILARALHDPDVRLSVRGFHLEGPYISPEDGYRGAHPKRWVRPPDWGEFMAFYRAAEGKILEVSLAPEVEGAMDFIRKLDSLGIVVALAHHHAPAEVVHLAADNGARLSTHLGNGCANMIHRHNNPLWPQLADDRLMASLIVDGFHLRPDEVRTFYKVKGPERTILVSDAVGLAGMPPGEYVVNGRRLVVDPAGVVRYPAQHVLAGAARPLSVDVVNMMKFTGCTLAQAIDMASRNPARLLGFDDLGEMVPGKRADLIVFRLGSDRLEIVKTIVKGRVVYSSPK